MTAKDKAKDLVYKFRSIIPKLGNFAIETEKGKQCAKIAVEELIKEQTMWQNVEPNPVLYWQDVLKEINKL